MVEQAIEMYCTDKNLPPSSKLAFFNEKPSINSGTTSYLARVCIEYLLKCSHPTGSASFYTNYLPETVCKIS